MRTSLFVLSLVLAAAPAQAASKIKKFKKLIVCAISGEQITQVGLGDGQSVNIADVLDLGAKTLESELQAVGVGIVPFAEAAEAAKTLEASLDKESDAALGAAANRAETGANVGADAGMQAAMAAAMNNPAMTPEQRAQMAKAFGASAGQAGAGLKGQMTAENDRMAKARRASREKIVYKDGSPSTGRARQFCPNASGFARRDESDGSTEPHFRFLDAVGADGWLFVNASFGDRKVSISRLMNTETTSSRFAPVWAHDVRYYDKEGKLVWENRRPIRSEKVDLGETVGSAKKALMNSAPAIIKSLVAEITN